MSKVISYLLNMLPYMIISIPIIIGIRVFIKIYRKDKKINWYHEIGLGLFIMFLVGLASQTIIPKLEIGLTGNFNIVKSGIHQLNLIPFKVFIETYNEVFINRYINYFIINFLGNIAMFIPIGFCIPLLWNINNKRVILIGFYISLFIEFCQLFLTRGTDIDDLWLNTLGTLVGLILYKLLFKKLNVILIKFRNFKIVKV